MLYAGISAALSSAPAPALKAPKQSLVFVLSGVSGMLGAALMFAGDLLLYGDKGWGESAQAYFAEVDPIASSSASLASSLMGASSRQRLIWGGLLGPLAVLFYVAGCYQMLLASGGQLKGKVAFGGYVGMFVFVGCYHSQYAYTGFIAQAGPRGTASATSLAGVAEAHKEYMGALKSSIKLFGAIGSLGLAAICASSRTPAYPRWMLLVSPAAWLLSVCETGLLQSLPAPYGLVVAGGSFNIAHFIFFTAATAAGVGGLLRRPHAAEDGGDGSEKGGGAHKLNKNNETRREGETNTKTLSHQSQRRKGSKSRFFLLALLLLLPALLLVPLLRLWTALPPPYETATALHVSTERIERLPAGAPDLGSAFFRQGTGTDTRLQTESVRLFEGSSVARSNCLLWPNTAGQWRASL